MIIHHALTVTLAWQPHLRNRRDQVAGHDQDVLAVCAIMVVRTPFVLRQGQRADHGLYGSAAQRQGKTRERLEVFLSG